MNRCSSVVLVAITMLTVLGACAKKDKDKAGADPGTAAPPPAAIDAAAAPAPAPDAAEAAAPAPDAAEAAAAPPAGELDGPFATVDDYCKKVTAAFKKDACFSQMDQIDMC